ncbi:putative ABC exporter domain-containing protein [Clostridium swellfunianum]|uniref:putative ABC exporter domain-containing protein n=1 Tax=Clostridium swellfunianum TaxID=1367462 RepID=UPI00202F1A00|nr:putative ABC exporter domain-containing protein [Clostridium swellfunianum]MCM0650341.1 putative ABC exporter domain-containing protein [Clostridium swellfunianum]
MRALFYIIRKSFKNGIKQLIKKPGKLIGYLIFTALIIFPLVMSSKTGLATSEINPDLYSSIATAIILLFSIPDLLSSVNNGANFFRGADINLVFTAPFSPQKVLIYGFIKQIYNSFIAVIFVLFQAPQLTRFKNIKPYAIFVIFGGLFLMLLVNSIIKMLLYSISSKSENSKVIIKTIFKVLLLAVVVFYFYSLYILRAPGKALMFLLSHSLFGYIPVYGWTREIIMAGITGISSITIVYLIILILFAALCIYILYSLKLDFYEDVLASTELKEATLTAARKGEKVYLKNSKKTRVRKVQYKQKGKGASAIFWRHILEYKKTGFGFINFASLLYAIVAITAGLFFPFKDLRVILGFTMYLHMIFTFASKWQQELSNPYIFLIPDNSFKKVVYSTVVDNIKNLIDGCIIFIISGILFKANLLLIILNIIAFASIGSLFVYGGVLARRVFGNTNSLVLTSLIRFALLLLIVAPGVAVWGILNGINNTLTGQITANAVFILYNVIFSSLIILLGKGIFENIELG